MKTLKTIFNVLLCVGSMLVLTESATIIPNLIGCGCFWLLIRLNPDTDV